MVKIIGINKRDYVRLLGKLSHPYRLSSRLAAFRGILLGVAEEKPRIFQSGRDIFLSLASIIIVMVLAVAFTGMCTFGRDTAENAHVNEVDAAAFLDLEARSVDFPVRLPDVPADWVANSARRGWVGNAPAPIVGWVIGKDGYVQLTQTGAPLAEAVDSADDKPRELSSTYQVGDTTVKLYTSTEADTRDLRVVDMGEVRFLITGAATTEQFDQLISTLAKTKPIVVTR